MRERIVDTRKSLTKARIALGSKGIVPAGPYSEQCTWIKKCVEYVEGKRNIEPWAEPGWQVQDCANLLCSFADTFAQDGYLGDKKTARALACIQMLRGEITPDPRGNGTTENSRYCYKVCWVALQDCSITSNQMRPTIEAVRSVWWAAHLSGAEPAEEQQGCKEELSKRLVAEALRYQTKAEIDPPLVLALVWELYTAMNLYPKEENNDYE